MSMKIVSWNVNGLQGILKKDENCVKTRKFCSVNPLSELIRLNNPDVLCLQEIKCTDKFNHKQYLPQYKYQYANHSERRASSGTLVLSKNVPLNVYYGLEFMCTVGEDVPENRYTHDGRLVTLEFENFYIINVYVPNSGNDSEEKLRSRIDVWERSIKKYIEKLLQIKAVIYIGDLNVAPTLKDHHGMFPNFPGSTVDERNAHNELLNIGLVDSYRKLYPYKVEFTWRFKNNKNRGCRLDYALISTNFVKYLEDSTIINHEGSDHRPIQLILKMQS